MRLRKGNGFTLGEMTLIQLVVIRWRAGWGRRAQWAAIQRGTVLAGARIWRGMFGSGRKVGWGEEKSDFEWFEAGLGSIAMTSLPVRPAASASIRQAASVSWAFVVPGRKFIRAPFASAGMGCQSSTLKISFTELLKGVEI